MHTSELQNAQRALVREMMRKAGVASPSALARRAGISTTTLTRLMNERTPHKYLLSSSTLAKLSAATGVAVPIAVMEKSPTYPAIDQARLAIAIVSTLRTNERFRPEAAPDMAAAIAEIYAYLTVRPKLSRNGSMAAAEALAEKIRRDLLGQKPQRNTEQNEHEIAD